MRIVSYIPAKIYPDVVTMDVGVYDETLRRTMAAVTAQCGSDCAFYTFGKVRTPGVSDLDLLVVTPDKSWRSVANCLATVIGQDGLSSYLYSHSPIVVPECCVPALAKLHTLCECTRIDSGKWFPKTAPEGISNPELGIQMVRHALWNGFLRLTATKLDARDIGLREVLCILHNFMLTAQLGNEYLVDPVLISFSTEQIREEVLQAEWHDRAALVTQWLSDVIALMNEVDARLDLQLMHRREEVGPDHGIASFWMHCIVSPLDCTVQNAPALQRILGGRPVVPLPRYVLSIMTEVARMSSVGRPLLNTFRLKREVSMCSSQFREGIAEVVDAAETLDRLGWQTFGALPVLGTEVRLPWVRRIVMAVRRQALFACC